MCSILAPVLELADSELGGTYWPFSRKDLTFVMRRREEAEGESRIIGSGRLGFLCVASAGLLDMAVGGACCDFLDMRGAASFRTCEKSCRILVSI